MCRWFDSASGHHVRKTNIDKKIEAIVIRKKDLFNGDRELVVLTNTGFKLKVFIKGISKSKNREIIASEVLSYSEFILNRNMIVNKISLINSFSDLKKDLSILKEFLYVLKILEQVIFDVPLPSIFDILLKALKFKDRTISNLIIKDILINQGIYQEDILDYEKYLYENLGIIIRKFMKYVN